MERAGQRSTGFWEDLGSGPVALSTICLWQLWSRGWGPNTAARHSCPPLPVAEAQHTPAETSLPQRLRGPVVEASFWSWERRQCGGVHTVYCLALSSNPFNMFHYSWMKNNPFKTLFTLAVIRVQEAPQNTTNINVFLFIRFLERILKPAKLDKKPLWYRAWMLGSTVGTRETESESCTVFMAERAHL